MKVDNYDDLLQFVKDNLDSFDSNTIEFTKKIQKEFLKKSNIEIEDEKIYTKNDINEKIDAIFNEIWKEDKKEITHIFKVNKFNIEITIQNVSNGRRNVPKNRLRKKLLELTKSEKTIIFDYDSVKNNSQEKIVDSIENFVENNLVLFNTKSTLFSKKGIKAALKNHPNIDPEKEKIHYNADMEDYLNKKYSELSEENKKKIVDGFQKNNFDISKTAEEISNEFVLKKGDVEATLKKEAFKILRQDVLANDEKLSKLTESIVKLFVKDKKTEINSITGDLKKIIKRFIPLIVSNGFPINLTNVNRGVMIANAGDSAQFLFIARAILAGFDSSNVDVRSSRYDCIVNYQNKIFRVQVKGISDNSVKYVDRSRGGRGIDYTNDRNAGKRITKDDCDIYAAVDKLTGTVYLIPIEHLDKTDKVSENISSLERYRENWKIFEELLERE